MRQWGLIILSALLLIMFNTTSWAQCAMCRGSVESAVSAGDTSMASNLNLGILYLFVAPYILFGVLAYFWFRASKKNGKKFKVFGPIGG